MRFLPSPACCPSRSMTLFLAFIVTCQWHNAAVAVDAKAKQKHDENTLSSKPVIKLTVAEARFVRSLERKLTTKLNSKENPGDRDTWYVLLLLDRAVLQRDTLSSSGSSRTLERAVDLSQKPDGVVVQGKHEAAIALARFLVGTNQAGKGLGSLAQPGPGTTPRMNGNKQWWFQAFQTQSDAKKYLSLALPQKDSGKK